MRNTLILILTIIGITCLIALAYLNSGYRTQTRVYSQYSLLVSTWEKYKNDFIGDDGRVIDYSQNDMTTSEGQSYALLRAVWSDDRQTFDLVWNWTKNNLKRQEDHLFGWSWGERDDQSFGFQANGGENFATDADTDIALALLFAGKRWDEPDYTDSALPIIKDIFEYGTEEINGKRFSLAGSWASSQTEIVMNPSYFMPYSWRIFSQVDAEHDWQSLVNPAYEVLNKVSNTPLSGQDSVGLPPNWISMDKQTGEFRQATQIQLNTAYGYDAMRTPWRIALDYIWFKDPQALAYLTSLSKLSDLYQPEKKLVAVYNHDGTPAADYESPAMYATALSYFQIVKPDLAEGLYTNKIINTYSNDTNNFVTGLNYYDQNWLWFSIALYNQDLPNFYAE